jgi:Fur family peroxide stress response transcriptional regulator
MATANIKELERLLKEHDIKPSHHRIRVLQYLTKYKNHPTVDMIYRELVEEIPTLSKTTLYNTLNLFVERGVISTLNLEESESRYDADISFHAHFKCSHCGRIYDIRMEVNGLEMTGLEDFEVTESHVYFKGICPICKNGRDEHINFKFI